MGLKDYLSSGTYTAISNLIYEKNLKRCTAMLEIWTNESKTLILANKGVTVEGTTKLPSVASLKNLVQTEPEDKNPEMYYIIDQDAKDSFVNYEGQLTRFNQNTNNWDKWELWEGLMVFVEDESKYYQRVNGSWQENPDCSSDARIWDKWMAPEIAMANGTNPMQQMYKFIKTLPQFKDCEDV